jgi:uncharacterized protein (TIGR02598 family)
MKASRSDAGFSLVEVVVALAVAAFCLLALLGLLSVGNMNNASSIEQTTAASLAAAVIADLRATPATATKSVRYGIPIPVAGGSTVTHTLFFDDMGTLSGSVDANANPAQTPSPRYRATLTFAATAAGKPVVPVRVQITWPALADLTASSSPTKFLGSYETVIGWDLN